MAGAIQIKRLQQDLFIDGLREGNKNSNILKRVSNGFKNVAFEAGFNSEAEFQDYAKNVIRKEIYGERYGKSDD